MYLPEHEYTGIFQGKTTPLLLSNLCLFCSLLFNYECFFFYENIRNIVFWIIFQAEKL